MSRSLQVIDPAAQRLPLTGRAAFYRPVIVEGRVRV